MEITLGIFDGDNAAIVGAAANTSLKLRRVSDGYLYDWNDGTFKAAGWITLAAAFSEIDATNLAGYYAKSVDPTTWADGWYQALIMYAGTDTLNDIQDVYIETGKELEQYLAGQAPPPGVTLAEVTAARDAVIAALPVAPDNAGIAAIKVKTDNLPVDPASSTQVATRLAAADYTAPGNVTVTIDTAAIAVAVWDEALAGHVAPGTTGGQFNIPAYQGPVAVVPAPPAANLQTLYGYAKEIGTTWAVGTAVKVTPLKGQIVNGVLLDDAIQTTTVGVDGFFQVIVDKGAKLVLELADFKSQLTITADDTRNVVAYLLPGTP